MAEDRPKACRDCRFHYNDDWRCFHEQAKSYDVVGDEKYEHADVMRSGGGKCAGGKLFEAPIPTPTKVVLRRWAVAAAILVTIVVTLHYF